MKGKSLLDELKAVNLEDESEKRIINQAVVDLESNKYEQKVKSTLLKQLRILALNQKLSKNGVELLTKLSKPNASDDYGKTLSTAFLGSIFK